MIPRLDRRASGIPLARSQELALEAAFVRKTIAQIEQHCPLEIWRPVPAEHGTKRLRTRVRLRTGVEGIPTRKGAIRPRIPGDEPGQKWEGSRGARDRMRATELES
jgi:hypothetical protein